MDSALINALLVIGGFTLSILAFPLIHYKLKTYWFYYKFYYGYDGDIGWVRNIAGTYIFSLIFVLITPVYFFLYNSIGILSLASLSLFGLFYQITMSDLKKSKKRIEQLKPNFNKYKEDIKPKLKWWIPSYILALALEILFITIT